VIRTKTESKWVEVDDFMDQWLAGLDETLSRVEEYNFSLERAAVVEGFLIINFAPSGDKRVDLPHKSASFRFCFWLQNRWRAYQISKGGMPDYDRAPINIRFVGDGYGTCLQCGEDKNLSS